MIALVTGSNGFIGSTLAEALLERNYRVRCLVRKTSNLTWLEHLNVEYVYGELLQAFSLNRIVDEVDVIFHLAGTTKAYNEKGYMDGNYRATLNLLTVCHLSHRKPRFIFVSSQAAGGPSSRSRPRQENDPANPVSLYGISKMIAELAVLGHTRHFPVTIIRPPSVYGPKDRDIYVLFKNIKRGVLPVLNGGQQKISMVYIDDLVEGLILAAEKETARGQIYNICGDEQLSWAEIGRTLANTLGTKARTVSVPLGLAMGVSFLSVIHSRLTNKPALLNRDKMKEIRQPAWLISNKKAKEELGFSPRFSLEEGLSRTITWYRQHGWL